MDSKRIPSNYFSAIGHLGASRLDLLVDEHVVSQPFNQSPLANPRISHLMSVTSANKASSVMQRLAEGDQLLSTGRWAEAKELFEQIVALGNKAFIEEQVGAHRGLGRALSRLGNYRLAIAQHRAALKLKESDAIYRDLAEVYEARGKYQQALDQLLFVSSNVPQEQAKNFISEGRILLLQRKSVLAFTAFEKARELLGPGDMQRGMVFAGLGEALVQQKRFKQAIMKFRVALAIYKKQLGQDNPSIAHVLGSIGDAYFAAQEPKAALDFLAKAVQGLADGHPMHVAVNYTKAKAYRKLGEFQKAVAFRRKALSLLPMSVPAAPFFVRLQMALADDLIQQALHETNGRQLLIEAKTILEAVLATDISIIDIREKMLTSYDLIGHYRLTRKLATCYHLLKEPEKAGALFLKRGLRLAKRFPDLGLRYLDRAFSVYKRLPGHHGTCFSILVDKGMLLQSQERLTEALKSYQKALRYRSQLYVQNRAQGIAELLEARSCEVDHDLWAQIERCQAGFYELKRVYFSDLEKGEQLSGQAVSRTLDLVIKFRNILDQAFGRFCRERIYRPNVSSKISSELYFQLKGSRIGLKKYYRELELYNYGVRVPGDLAALKKVFQKVQNLLKASGNVTKEGVLIARLGGDFSGFSGELKPHVSALRTILSRLEIGKSLTVKWFCESILQEMSAKGVVTQDAHQADLWLLVDEHRSKLNSLETLVVDQLKEQSYKTSLSHYPLTQKALFEAQPFYYYFQKPEMAERSWLDRITDIGNDAKHVRLTPMHIQDNLSERLGTLALRRTKVMVEYLSPIPAFFSWSFFSSLQSNSERTPAERANLSRQIFQTLKGKGMFIHRRGYHLVSGDQVEDQNALRQKVRTALPDLRRGDVRRIVDLLIRRHKQGANYLDRRADRMVNLDKLVEESLARIKEIVITLGRDRGLRNPPRRVVLSNAPPLPDDASKGGINKRIQSLRASLSSLDTSRLQQLQVAHRHVVEIGYLTTRLGDSLAACQHYVQYAKTYGKRYPWLAICYLRKAFRLSRESAALGKESLKIATLLGKFSAVLGTEVENHRLMDRALAHYFDFNVHHTVKMGRQLIAKRDAHIDRDHLVQLYDLKRQIAALKYKCFACTLSPEDRNRALQVQNEIGEMAMRIHHLLDQSLMRWANRNVFKSGTHRQVKMPCVGSERGLFAVLKRNQLGNLKTLFPSLFDAIANIQPYAHKSWWETIYALSLEGKHIRLALVEPDFLRVNKAAKKIEEFYQMPYLFSTAYPWTFQDLVGADRSKTLHDVLTSKNILKNNRWNLRSQKGVEFGQYIDDPTSLKKDRIKTFLRQTLVKTEVKYSEHEIDQIFQCLVYWASKAKGKMCDPRARLKVLKVLDRAVNETDHLVRLTYDDAKVQGTSNSKRYHEVEALI